MVLGSELALREPWFVPSHALVSALLRELSVFGRVKLLLYLWPSFHGALWPSRAQSGVLWLEDCAVTELRGPRTRLVLVTSGNLGGRFCVRMLGEIKKTGNHLSSLSKSRGLFQVPCSCGSGILPSPGSDGQCALIWWLSHTEGSSNLCCCFCHPSGSLSHSDMASLYSPSLILSAWVLCVCLLILLPFFSYLLSLSLCLELKLSQRLCDWFCQI